jgi:hypothetical protein
MPEQVRRALPPLYATENIPIDDKIVGLKLFCPYNGWEWYIVEFDGSDILFGYVKGAESEWAYFSLNELARLTVLGCLPAVERECHFNPMRFGDIVA